MLPSSGLMFFCDMFREKSVNFKMSKRKHVFGEPLSNEFPFRMFICYSICDFSRSIQQYEVPSSSQQAVSSSTKSAFISRESSVAENELHCRSQMEGSHAAALSVVRPYTLATIYRNWCHICVMGNVPVLRWNVELRNATNAVGVRVNDELCETTKSENS